MLEGLDQIDWKRLRHSYGIATDVPEMIRQMAVADIDDSDDDEYDNLFSTFLNIVNHQGDVKSATVQSIPFLIELLDYKVVPRRDLVLQVLAGIIHSCNEHIEVSSQIGTLGYEIDTYRNISNGFPTYIRLLKERDGRIRRSTAYLLSLLPEHHTYSRLPVYKAARIEQDKQTLIRMIECLGVLALQSKRYGWLNATLARHYKKFLEELAASHEELDVTITASQVWVDLLYLENWQENVNAPSFIIELLTEHVIHPIQIGDDTKAVEKLSKLGIHALVKALDYSETTPDAAHKICREMLDLTFERRSSHRKDFLSDKWNNYLSVYDSYDLTTSRMYHFREENNFILQTSNGGLYPSQKAVLMTIVNNDLFWHLPTNLFSFFYGLPDDREELRKLAEGDSKKSS
jgi:hypothetical protein